MSSEKDNIDAEDTNENETKKKVTGYSLPPLTYTDHEPLKEEVATAEDASVETATSKAAEQSEEGDTANSAVVAEVPVVETPTVEEEIDELPEELREEEPEEKVYTSSLEMVGSNEDEDTPRTPPANERSRARKVRKIITGSLAGIVILGLGFVFFQSKNNDTGTKDPDKEIEKVGEKSNAPVSIDKQSSSFQIKQIVDKGETVTLKAADTATRVDIFFDPMCPYCAIVDQELDEDLRLKLLDGQIELFFTPVSFLDKASSDNYSTRAVNAFLEISDGSPEHAMGFLNAIYDPQFQPKEGDEYKPVSNKVLAETAEKIGVPSSVTAKFNDMRFEDWIAESSQAQQNRRDLFEQFSTPAVFVGLSYDEDTSRSGTPSRVTFTSEKDVRKNFNKTLGDVRESETAARSAADAAEKASATTKDDVKEATE